MPAVLLDGLHCFASPLEYHSFPNPMSGRLSRRLVVTVGRLFGMPLGKETVDVTKVWQQGGNTQQKGTEAMACMLCNCMLSGFASALKSAVDAVCGWGLRRAWARDAEGERERGRRGLCVTSLLCVVWAGPREASGAGIASLRCMHCITITTSRRNSLMVTQRRLFSQRLCAERERVWKVVKGRKLKSKSPPQHVLSFLSHCFPSDFQRG